MQDWVVDHTLRVQRGFGNCMPIKAVRPDVNRASTEPSTEITQQSARGDNASGWKLKKLKRQKKLKSQRGE